MNRPSYLSPSALDTFLKNPDEYYLKYLAKDKPPRFPQNQAMAVGSAFDAYVKSCIQKILFGDEGHLSFDILFEKQVEPQNRDFALGAGAICFQQYKDSGALGKMITVLNKAVKPPRMEFSEQVTLPNGVVVGGKPDLDYELADFRVVHDWKVNGYCTPSGKTPSQGYQTILDGFSPVSTRHGKTHKTYSHWNEGGFDYSTYPNIEKHEVTWARQIATYGWMGGSPVGANIKASVDQLCCNPGPRISIALHRCEITAEFQQDTYNRYADLWNRITSGHYFTEMTKEQSDAKCAMLDNQAAAYRGEHGDWFQSITRS